MLIKNNHKNPIVLAGVIVPPNSISEISGEQFAELKKIEMIKRMLEPKNGNPALLEIIEKPAAKSVEAKNAEVKA
jgi:hypothetical protein